MNTAIVTFSRDHGMVDMTLSVDGRVVAKSSCEESIARELQILGARFLSIGQAFTTSLPTSGRTLTQAGRIDFNEPMAALKLIAACCFIGEVAPYPYPERRGKARTATGHDQQALPA